MVTINVWQFVGCLVLAFVLSYLAVGVFVMTVIASDGGRVGRAIGAVVALGLATGAMWLMLAGAGVL